MSQTVVTPPNFFWRLLGYKGEEKRIPLKVGMKDITDITDNYMKCKALQSIKEQGFIQGITYEK